MCGYLSCFHLQLVQVLLPKTVLVFRRVAQLQYQILPIFPAAPKEPDNTAGTAASITVMILLIGTLIGLLVFYLRTRPVDRAAPSSAPSSARAGFSNETYEPVSLCDSFDFT